MSFFIDVLIKMAVAFPDQVITGADGDNNRGE